MTIDDKWLRMKAQVPTSRLQEIALDAYAGRDPGPLTEAERYFYDRALAERVRYPKAVPTPLDL